MSLNQHEVDWKLIIHTTLETMIAFYIATFCGALYLTHRVPGSWFLTAIMGILYLIVVGLCGTRIIQKLPIAALMLIIPIAPFLALTMVISLIPILQYFR